MTPALDLHTNQLPSFEHLSFTIITNLPHLHIGLSFENLIIIDSPDGWDLSPLPETVGGATGKLQVDCVLSLVFQLHPSLIIPG